MYTATPKVKKEARKNPVPVKPVPAFPNIYEKVTLLINKVNDRIIDCNLKSKYRNNVIKIEMNIAQNEPKTVILNNSRRRTSISNWLNTTFDNSIHVSEIRNCNSMQYKISLYNVCFITLSAFCISS